MITIRQRQPDGSMTSVTVAPVGAPADVVAGLLAAERAAAARLYAGLFGGVAPEKRKGLDLSRVADQRLVAPWTLIAGRRGVFESAEGHRMRRENLSCELGGGKHDYEHRGRDFANRGAAGIVEVDVRVCRVCLRDKR
jgi:hypothetical protein